MRFPLLLAFLTALPTTAAAQDNDVEVVYVQANRLNLRDSPKANSEVIAQLVVNSALIVQEDRGKWLKVSIDGRPSKHAVTGWVMADYTLNRPLKYDEALTTARNNRNVLDAIMWTERAVSIDGTRLDGWDDLANLYQKNGRRDDADRVRSWQKGSEPLHLAVCDGRRATLVAEVTPEGTVKPMVASTQTGMSDNQLVSKAIELAKTTWYKADHYDQSISTVSGTPFVRPFLAPRHEEEPMSPYQPGKSRSSPGTGHVLVLGPCSETDAVYSTAPLVPVTTTALPMEELNRVFGIYSRAVSGKLFGLRAEWVDEETRSRAISLTVPYSWDMCGEEPWPGSASTFGFMRSDDHVPVAFGGRASSSDGAPPDTSNVRWFSLRVGGQGRLLAITDARWASAMGHSVIMVDPEGGSDDGGPMAHVPTRTWGC